MAGGHAWPGGVHGRGACVVGGVCGRGACIPHMPLRHAVNVLAVRILLECILVDYIFNI